MSNHLDLEEQEQIEQLKAFWAQYGGAITWLLVLVFGAFAAWNGYQYWQRHQAAQAAAMQDEVERLAIAGDLATAQRAFDEMKSRFAGSVYAQHAALLLAKAALQGNNTTVAIAALQWASENGHDTALATLARLRWSSVLMDAKNWDAALSALNASVSDVELESAVQERRADILAAKGDTAGAIASYQEAFAASAAKPDVQRLVRIKLNSLGVDPESTPQVLNASAQPTK